MAEGKGIKFTQFLIVLAIVLIVALAFFGPINQALSGQTPRVRGLINILLIGFAIFLLYRFIIGATTAKVDFEDFMVTLIGTGLIAAIMFFLNTRIPAFSIISNNIFSFIGVFP